MLDLHPPLFGKGGNVVVPHPSSRVPESDVSDIPVSDRMSLKSPKVFS